MTATAKTIAALTGSIGMGKSTVAGMFADAGIPVWDADAAVHRLYAPGQAGAVALAALVPDAVGPEGVDRAALTVAIRDDPALLKKIEAVIHPLVARDRDAFIAAEDAPLILCDIPLLFENGGAAKFSPIIVVSAPADVQKARVLDRPGMTADKFAFILGKQMPDAEKRARADFVIENGGTLEDTRTQVRNILRELGH